MRRIGQKTGISNILDKVNPNAKRIDFVAEYLYDVDDAQVHS